MSVIWKISSNWIEKQEQRQAPSKYETFVTSESKLFVSIMAGTKMETLTRSLKEIVKSPRIIRVHPNTPAMVGQGCAVYSLGEGT